MCHDPGLFGTLSPLTNFDIKCEGDLGFSEGAGSKSLGSNDYGRNEWMSAMLPQRVPWTLPMPNGLRSRAVGASDAVLVGPSPGLLRHLACLRNGLLWFGELSATIRDCRQVVNEGTPSSQWPQL